MSHFVKIGPIFGRNSWSDKILCDSKNKISDTTPSGPSPWPGSRR